MSDKILAEGFILVMNTEINREQVAYCPTLEATDVLSAYAPFFYTDRGKADADVEDEYGEFIMPCTVMEDGSIVTEYWTRSPAEICRPYVADIPAFAKVRAPTP